MMFLYGATPCFANRSRELVVMKNLDHRFSEVIWAVAHQYILAINGS